jgi:hypothetical protein
MKQQIAHGEDVDADVPSSRSTFCGGFFDGSIA